VKIWTNVEHEQVEQFRYLGQFDIRRWTLRGGH